jgi:hypothetical protein
MEKMQKMINLDECVINALNLFIEKSLSPLPSIGFRKPIVVGSGNAAATGKILMNGRDAVFADEGTFLKKLGETKNIDTGIIISSSGKKHAPMIARELKKKGLKIILLTNNENSPAGKIADKEYLFPRNSEPYSYNTSTYLGMILAKTHESPKAILKAVKSMSKKIPRNLNKFDSFFFIIPPELEIMKEIFMNKFDELFGARISARVFTMEQAKHAKTIVPSDRELFVSFGCKNNLFGKKRIEIPLPKNAGYGTLFSMGYYFIGKIQQQNKPYFRENIGNYLKQSNKIFGEQAKLFS